VTVLYPARRNTTVGKREITGKNRQYGLKKEIVVVARKRHPKRKGREKNYGQGEFYSNIKPRAGERNRVFSPVNSHIFGGKKAEWRWA